MGRNSFVYGMRAHSKLTYVNDVILNHVIYVALALERSNARRLEKAAKRGAENDSGWTRKKRKLQKGTRSSVVDGPSA